MSAATLSLMPMVVPAAALIVGDAGGAASIAGRSIRWVGDGPEPEYLDSALLAHHATMRRVPPDQPAAQPAGSQRLLHEVGVGLDLKTDAWQNHASGARRHRWARGRTGSGEHHF